jgi:hypothetical protein
MENVKKKKKKETIELRAFCLIKIDLFNFYLLLY